MFNKIQLAVFTLLVFVFCMVIFPIHCKTRGWRKSLKSQWIGKITTQRTKTSKVNTVRCILFNILASIYRFESFTWIPIQILYIHGHFKLTQWAWAACASPCLSKRHFVFLAFESEKLWSNILELCFSVMRSNAPLILSNHPHNNRDIILFMFITSTKALLIRKP